MSEPNDVAGHNHRYPPSRDDCPRCVRVREILKPSEPKIVAECFTCAYASCDPVTGLTDEALPNTPLTLLDMPYRPGLPDLRAVWWHKRRGHDVRPVAVKP